MVLPLQGSICNWFSMTFTQITVGYTYCGFIFYMLLALGNGWMEKILRWFWVGLFEWFTPSGMIFWPCYGTVLDRDSVANRFLVIDPLNFIYKWSRIKRTSMDFFRFFMNFVSLQWLHGNSAQDTYVRVLRRCPCSATLLAAGLLWDKFASKTAFFSLVAPSVWE
jgi:hypothetical protein